MNANATVKVLLLAAESIKEVSHICAQPTAGEYKISYQRRMPHSQSAVKGCEVDDVFEITTSGGRKLYGVINSAGGWVKISDQHDAEAMAMSYVQQ